MLVDNNSTVESLTINDCWFFFESRDLAPIPTPMENLKCLEICCNGDDAFEKIISYVHAPQFKNLDTAHLSLPDFDVRMVATDGSGHTFVSSQTTYSDINFHPLRHLGAVITTLRLDREMSLQQLDPRPRVYAVFRSLDAVQVLEFDGTTSSARGVLPKVLSVDGVFPGLKVIRVLIGLGDCEGVLQLLATVLGQRAEEGNPLTTVEPLFAEVEDGLGQELREEWEKYYEAEGIHNLLSR